MRKVKYTQMLKKDKEMMRYLFGYVRGKPFPLKHTFMDVDDLYGIRMFKPSQIFETTEPEAGKENTRILITIQDLNKATKFVSEAGVWKSLPKDVFSLYDASNRLMGYVKISYYYYYHYYYDTVNSKRRRRSTRSEWSMREYHLSSKYFPPTDVDRKKVLLTVINKEQKSNNDIHSLSDMLGTIDLSTTQPATGG